MHIRFDQKRVVITGAGKGLGREIAIRLAESGAQVVAISRTQADLESLKAAIHCETITAELSDPDGAYHAAEAAGEIDLLVNNAGISILQPFLETTVEAFDQIMAVNVRAMLIVSQVIARGMIRRGKGGAIVNVSSQASTRAVLNHTAYCASKGAVDQLTRMMALELGPYQIRVNAVHPTVVMTPMGIIAWSDPARSAPMLARIPLNRFAEPFHVADAVLYLLSEQADMINGIMLPIDGGFLTT